MHPIGVVAERTGLSQDVLRVWERRYGVVEPVRDETGRRLYSDADIERLRLLAAATEAGRSIGQLSRLTTTELFELVRGDEMGRRSAPRAVPNAAAAAVEEAMQRTRELDGAGLEAVLRRAATLYGLGVFLDAVAAPLFRRIGEEWHRGMLSPVQEHLASAVARSVLGAQLISAPVPASAPSVVVATPAGERHEIGALMAAAAATADGWRATYLGPDLPAEQIAYAAERTAARAVGLSVIFPPNQDVAASEITRLRGLLPPGVKLIVGGGGVEPLRATLQALGIDLPSTLDEFRAALRAFPPPIA